MARCELSNKDLIRKCHEGSSKMEGIMMHRVEYIYIFFSFHMIFEHGFLQMTLVKVMQRMMGLLKSKDVWILSKKEKVYQSSAACKI